MSEEKYILFSLNDDKSKKLGQTISNSTCKKILDLISEREISEEDISKKLGMPINTVEYNLKKLLHSGLVEKGKNFFWSKKGKKIPVYKIANKLIIISPKNSLNLSSKLKEIFPVVLISVILTFLVFWYSNLRTFSQESLLKTTDVSFAEAAPVALSFSSVSSNWIWFLFGWFLFVVLFLLWSLRKSQR